MAPLPRRLKKHADEIRFLSKCSSRQRKAFLQNANPSLITALCECASNIVKGNVPMSKSHKTKLTRYKKHLRALANKRVPHRKRRHILVQQGGFLGLILKPVIQTLGGLLLGAINK